MKNQKIKINNSTELDLQTLIEIDNGNVRAAENLFI